MDDRLTDVITACRTKNQIAVTADIPYITLLTMRDLGESDIALIRNFQTVIREQLGVDIVVIGGGCGCTRVHVTIGNVPTDALAPLMNVLLSLDFFREEASKAGFFHAHTPDIHISLATGELDPGSGPVINGLILFVCYSDADDKHLAELDKHLKTLTRQGKISPWHRRKITAGSEWASQVDFHINKADILLLLISSDFLASDYCIEKEMKIALRRHDSGDARVIPIIVRAVDWEGSDFSRLQVIPKDGKPIASSKNPDEAWMEVAKDIRHVVEEILTKKVRLYITESRKKHVAPGLETSPNR